MADVQVKPEIKVDPAASTPVNMAELEGYEDDTDLYIPAPPDAGGSQAWLVKVPKYMWEAWADIYHNAPDSGEKIRIGTMLVHNPDDPPNSRSQIKLDPSLPQHADLPNIYNVDIKSTGYNNTVVFSEKDHPGHSSSRPKPFSRSSRPRGIPSKTERYGNNNNAGKPGRYRTAIPKQTALAPLIWHVADAAPEQDESYFAHFQKMYEKQIKPKHTTTYVPGVDRRLHPAASHLNTFPSFGLSSRPGAKTKKSRPKEKMVRMPQQELLNRLYECFAEYKFWALKTLRAKLQQPEAYIKETLDTIAVLHRSGDAAMHYKLKDEYATFAAIAAAQAGVKEASQDEYAPPLKSEVEESEMDMDGEGLGSADDDAPDEEFEDVKME